MTGVQTCALPISSGDDGADGSSGTSGVKSSMMMLISVFSLSFFVLAIKRKKEFQHNISGRESLKYYNLKILNSIIALSLFCSIVSYSIHIYIKNNNLIITIQQYP